MLKNRKGFTLIELLIVVVIIGILAAIAIPKFAATKDKAYVTAMTSDLKNVGTAEEEYYADHHAYTTVQDSTGIGQYFKASSGVTVTIAADSGTGYWSATATHGSLANSICGIGYGTANPEVSTAGEGEPACIAQ
jgi:prepilin-type N-terminal cleavage/methylation domain-containing protein